MPNIGDVARHLGVSRSTVSYALSGKRSISSEMKARVQAAVRELEFYPSASGRALATARTNTLALLAPMAENATPEVALQFVSGVVQSARSFGYDILLVTGEEAFTSIDRLDRARQVDGFVILDVEDSDPRVLALQENGAACVLVGMPEGVTDLDRVDLDWREAGTSLLEALAGAGHRHVGLVGAPSVAYDLGMTYAARFRDGVAAAAQRMQVRVTEVPAHNDFFETIATIRALLETEAGITGLVIQHEAAVAPVFSALKTAGYEVPRDYSVVGMSIDKLGFQFAPPTSGIVNSSTEITRQAVSLLIERLEDPALEARSILISPEYRDLATVAPPRPTA
ncbi:LacI family DNA-binding transcriptional regulator [Tessaracoccus defluvii]